MNHETQVSEFIRFSLSEQSLQGQMSISLSFSLYLIEHMGNQITILVIISDPYLHSPMYFLLSNLSLLDIFLTTTTIPDMLVNLLCGITIISFSAYLTQMHFLITFGTAKRSFSRSWLATTTWPSATHCTTWQSWLPFSVPCGWRYPGFQATSSPWPTRYWCSTCHFVSI